MPFSFARVARDVGSPANSSSKLSNRSIVMQTAIIGEADVLCTRDKDLFEKPAVGYLNEIGISVLDDIALMHRLRS